MAQQGSQGVSSSSSSSRQIVQQHPHKAVRQLTFSGHEVEIVHTCEAPVCAVPDNNEQ